MDTNLLLYTTSQSNSNKSMANGAMNSMYIPIKALNTFSRDWKI